MITFTVDVEDTNGKHLKTFFNVPAQTRKEAINKVKQQLTFTAELDNEPNCEAEATTPKVRK